MRQLVVRRLWMVVVLGAAMAAMAVLPLGCDEGGAAAEEGRAEGRGTIGLSVLTLGNPFFGVIADTMTEEAAKHGYDVRVVDSAYDVSRQQDQVKDFIVQGVSAIVLNPADSRAIGPAIIEANEAGIPVFTCDIRSMADGAEVVSHIATDNFQGGRLAAEAMIEALGDGGGEVLILDFRQAESCLLRVDGFKEVIEEHNAETDEGRVEIVAELPGDGERDKGFRMTEDGLQAHPNLAGIFAINDPSALGAYAALERAGKQGEVVIIGFDGQPEGKRAIRDGMIYADPVQFPDRIARQTVRAIIAYFEGEGVEPVQLIPTALYRQEDGLADGELE